MTFCYDIGMSKNIRIDLLYKTQVSLLDVHLSYSFIGLTKVENMQSLDIFLGRDSLILVSFMEGIYFGFSVATIFFYHAVAWGLRILGF